MSDCTIVIVKQVRFVAHAKIHVFDSEMFISAHALNCYWRMRVFVLVMICQSYKNHSHTLRYLEAIS